VAVRAADVTDTVTTTYADHSSHHTRPASALQPLERPPEYTSSSYVAVLVRYCVQYHVCEAIYTGSVVQVSAVYQTRAEAVDSRSTPVRRLLYGAAP